MDEVLAEAARPSLLVVVENMTAGLEVLRSAGLAVEADDKHLRVALPACDAALVTKLLAGAGLYLSELRPESVSLEELFLSITTHAEVSS